MYDMALKHMSNIFDVFYVIWDYKKYWACSIDLNRSCSVGHYHHGMARPPRVDGSYEYIEWTVVDSRQWVVLELGVGRGANNSPQ
jgi:hypothetical protein